MEIILKKDVANLGHADDIVNVKTGYAVNYLIPQGFAIMATPSAKKVHAENLRQRAHKIAKFVASYVPSSFAASTVMSFLSTSIPTAARASASCAVVTEP